MQFYDMNTEPRVGESKVRLRHGFETLLNILRATLIFGPLRLYGTAGLLLLGVGMVYGFGIAFTVDQGFPTFGLALITSGLMLLALGLIADQISHWRLSMMETNPIDPSRPKASQKKHEGEQS